MPGSFLDTNILVYLASSDAVKAQRAEAIISGGGTISVQFLNELANANDLPALASGQGSQSRHEH